MGEDGGFEAVVEFLKPYIAVNDEMLRIRDIILEN